jgi:hypothetical protein
VSDPAWDAPYWNTGSSVPAKKLGRPSEFTDELADEICELLMDGMSMRKICQSKDMPNRRTIERWMERDSDFAAKCARARVWQADYMDDLILDTAMNCTSETAQADRVKISAFQWRAAKLAPKVYGDKTEVAITGSNGGPIQSVLHLDDVEASRAYQRMIGEDK